jgi:hypothetical protein
MLRVLRSHSLLFLPSQSLAPYYPRNFMFVWTLWEFGSVLFLQWLELSCWRRCLTSCCLHSCLFSLAFLFEDGLRAGWQTRIVATCLHLVASFDTGTVAFGKSIVASCNHASADPVTAHSHECCHLCFRWSDLIR